MEVWWRYVPSPMHTEKSLIRVSLLVLGLVICLGIFLSFLVIVSLIATTSTVNYLETVISDMTCDMTCYMSNKTLNTSQSLSYFLIYLIDGLAGLCCSCQWRRGMQQSVAVLVAGDVCYGVWCQWTTSTNDVRQYTCECCCDELLSEMTMWLFKHRCLINLRSDSRITVVQYKFPL